MPRQNRVTPFGALISTEARGTLMGNRGCLHDDQRNIRRLYACRRWIICALEFRGRHREIMAPRRYTELFFLDEATAMSAGHRPCAECQNVRYRLFREIWAAANPDLAGASSVSADEMDRIVHAERVDGKREKSTYLAPAAELPPGAMVADDGGVPYLVREQSLMHGEPQGYGPGIHKPDGVMFHVLTPKSIVRALVHAYPVMVHPSAH